MKLTYTILFLVVATLLRLDASYAQGTKSGDPDGVMAELYDEDEGDDLLTDLLGDLGVEGSDLTCLQETNDFVATSPDLGQASMAWLVSMDVSDDMQSITYGADETQALQTACDNAKGLFLNMPHQKFQCTPEPEFAEAMGEDSSSLENDTFAMTVENMASCHADTPSCQGFNQGTLLENTWAGFGLDCVPVEDVAITKGDQKSAITKGDANNNNRDDDLPPSGLLFLAVIAIGGFLFGVVFIVRRSRSGRETAIGDGYDETATESESQGIV